MNKLAQLKELARQRRQDSQTGLTKKYKQVGDFHGGVFDKFGHVSPWSNSACNVDSPLMIIAQDWTSEETAQQPPEDVDLGYSPNLPTNKNLQALLREHFGLQFSDVYATNLFVFVKPGNLSARIPMADLRYSAMTYTVPQIQIVKPRTILCL